MSIARLLIVVDLLLVALGLLWPAIDKIGLGRLPGDITIERDNFRVDIPLASSLLVGAILSLVLWIANLEHDPEKWIPVFRKDHAQSKA